MELTSKIISTYIMKYNLCEMTNEGLKHKYTGEVFPEGELKLFDWKWSRKSWGEVMRPVFIDFGDENLFWVRQGMGTSYGKGKYVSKEKFFAKYFGTTANSG